MRANNFKKLLSIRLLRAYLFVLFLITFTISSSLCFANFSDETKIQDNKIERYFVFDTLPLNLEELTKASDRIFTGLCVENYEVEYDPESRLPVVVYKFQILDPIKRLENKEEITFKQWLPTARNTDFRIGNKYVVFLYENSERGLTSPVGFLQGQFQLENKGRFFKDEYVRNKVNNIGLSKNLRTQSVISLANKDVHDYINNCSEKGLPIRYREFISAVKDLVEE